MVKDDHSNEKQQATPSKTEVSYGDFKKYIFANSRKNNIEYELPLFPPTDLSHKRDQGDNGVSRGNQDYCTQTSRLPAFTGWPHSTPSPDSLAIAGIFKTGRQGWNRCHAPCRMGLKKISPDDDPKSKHIKLADNSDLPTYIFGVDTSEQNRETMLHPQRLKDERSNLKQGENDAVVFFECEGRLLERKAGDDQCIERCKRIPYCPLARRMEEGGYIGLNQALDVKGEEKSKVNQGQSPKDLLTSSKTNMMLRNTNLEENRHRCTMVYGISNEEFVEALLQLRASGNENPSLDDLLNGINEAQRQTYSQEVQQESVESILKENAFLKRNFKCYLCRVNDVNALFLPCAHHRMCMDCAIKNDVTLCPVCDRNIVERLETCKY